MTESNSNQQKLDAIETIHNQVREADSLADTPFSELFHEARTSDKRYTGATADYTLEIEDGEPTLTQQVCVKTRQGEHWMPDNDPDLSIGMHAKPFLGTEEAKQRITDQLQKEIDTLKRLVIDFR
ncbi:hypothetical protein [Natrinema sp. DC36]|uniref:hypothetical protein n=1 Tax=Natrinema sp. DC36 TaxID=2878680 RepID=UPI001CF07AF0|nr:hypothetical protein [Natrinema sp. DC36]